MSRLNFLNTAVIYSLFAILVLTFFGKPDNLSAAGLEALTSTIGEQDALLITDPEGKIIVSKNENRKLVPASILKIFTSLVALHYLGQDYRYSTEFYMDKNSNLKIKGFGDPLLISEVVQEICDRIALLIGAANKVNDLILDDSYFKPPLTIPGISSSSEPYDAPNGALCVNFNTVYFKRTQNGFVSAESQTPLLPFAEKRIKDSKLKSGRIVLSHNRNENTIYTGKLFQYFLHRQGIQLRGSVKLGQVNQADDKLIYRYVSRFSLPQIISKLLEHSNNFTTNQLLITAGVKVFGAPGNLKKGVAAALDYAGKILHAENMRIVEGSGISRDNRISAQQMDCILKEFEPYHLLLRQEGREYFKTGTLYGINTRAGYYSDMNNSNLYRYVVMLNTPGKSTRTIMDPLFQILDKNFL